MRSEEQRRSERSGSQPLSPAADSHRLRYVVLRHDEIDLPHVDFMVELSAGALLATWRLDTWPAGGDTPAERLGDHRRLYLDYQGPLSDNRGRVRQIESGECQLTIERQLIPGAPQTICLILHGAARPHRLTLSPAGAVWKATGDSPPG